MPSISDRWMRLKALLSRRERERQIEMELKAHFDALVRDLVESGMNPVEAREEAQKRFGDVRVFQKELRKMENQRISAETRSAFFDELLQDVRYGVRQLLRKPAFTAIVIGTLAVGIGANTAVFSVLKGVFLDPLPFEDPHELTYVWHGSTDGGCCGPLSGPDFTDLRAATETFEDIAVMSGFSTNLNADGEPAVVAGARITPSMFDLIGTAPVMGRSFVEDDQMPGSRVVVLSDGLWRNRLGGDPSIIGSTIRLDRESHTVVGVMPPGFNVPSAWQFNQNWDVYFPLTTEYLEEGRGSHWLLAIGRLESGVSIETADTELKSISAALEERYPDTNTEKTTYVQSMHERVMGRVGTQLILLLSAAGFMLLIVCGNVASLLLSRATARQTEMAVRASVGAGRGRIIRQLLTESLLLSVIGGAAGITLAFVAMVYLKSVVPSDLPRLTNIGIDLTVLGYALGISIATGLLFGLAPALTASRGNLTESLKEGKAAPHAGSRRAVLRGALVATQFALALVLANGAALMVRSYLNFRGMEQGFDPENVLTASLSLQGDRYEDVWDRDLFLRDAMEQIRAIPGVRYVGAKSRLPLNGGTNSQVWNEDDPDRPLSGGDGPLVELSRISGDYFDAAGINLVAGRLPEPNDSIAANPATIINRAMAERLWPNEDPIGKRYSFRENPPNWMTVVGVVENVRQWGPYRSALSEHYLPYTAPGWGQSSRMYLIIKTDIDPLSLVGQIRKAVLAVDPDQPISDIRTMERVLSDQFAGQKFNTMLVGIFAGIALLLVSAGVYGVVSFFVAQTSREIGIRMALGAAQSKVLGLTLMRGLKLAAIGAGVGVGGIFASTTVIRSLLYGANPVDIPTMIVGVVAIVGVGVLASLLPAQRAARVSPVTALRSD